MKVKVINQWAVNRFKRASSDVSATMGRDRAHQTPIWSDGMCRALSSIPSSDGGIDDILLGLLAEHLREDVARWGTYNSSTLPVTCPEFYTARIELLELCAEFLRATADEREHKMEKS